MKYIITVSGCDDSTTIEMELDEEQVKLLKEVADKISEAATYGCMPSMEVERSYSGE